MLLVKRVLYIIVSAAILFALPPTRVRAQLPPKTDSTRTPIPGAGHDYIGGFTEMVNPATGSVSLRVPIIVPPSRGITLPFQFTYDSSGVNFLSQLPDRSNPTPLYWLTTNQDNNLTANGFSQAGWGAGLPQISRRYISWKTGGHIGCKAAIDFVYQDAQGVRHNLGLTNYSDPGGTGPCTINSQDWPVGFTGSIVTQGGEGSIIASLPSTNWPDAETANVAVVEADGTAFGFSAGLSNSIGVSAPSDRYGNYNTVSTINYPAFTFTDTAGRSTIQDSGFAVSPETITVSGLTNHYTVNWTTLSTPTFTTPITVLNGTACTAPTHLSWGAPNDHAVSSFTLPNSNSFSFSYDSVYGLVNKITYPTGGYVRYVWGINPQSQEGEYILTNGQNSFPCQMYYGTPAVTDRYVSFDGINEVLHQVYTYNTVWQSSPNFWWSSKTTTVKTYDLLLNTSFETVYTYTPVYENYQPNAESGAQPQIAVESSVAYYNDLGSTLLKTDAKIWANERLLTSSQTTYPSGPANKTIWNYNSNEMQIEKDDYDFGTSGVGPLLRKTATAYATFGTNHIVDKPSSVTIYDSANNKFAETDYTYDSPVGSMTSGITNHSGGCNCGSLTKESRWLNPSGFLNTTFTNDDTGQRLSATDPLGNTTAFSYTDSYSSGTPPSPTNTYLTKITHPTTNGVNHIEKYAYAYTSGELTSSTDQNSLVTSYLYNDSGNLARLKETDYPDGGKTTIAYNDAAPSPSVTTSRLVTSSPSVSISTTTVMDGLGHVTQTQLTTDPDGATYTDTTYDGLGRVRTQSNPYRSQTEATYGVTTNYFDGIGRPCLVVPPDGTLPSGNGCPSTQPSNTIFTTYSGNTTTVTDQSGKSGKSVTDGLGRLKQVFEDPANLNYETDYQYDVLDDLLCVAQKGNNSGMFSSCASSPATWRPRTFSYDSLSRLLTASNPESGTISYAYDANGNLFTKTSPKPNQTGTATVVTTYTYDSLNRLTQKSFNDSLTPTIRYGYDAAALSGCNTAPPTLTDSYPIGARTSMCDGAGAESWSHDSMGRVLGDQRTTNGVTYGFPQTYNLDGSVSTLNYGNYSGSDLVTFMPGGAGRPVSETGTVNSWTIVSAAHYAPNGALCGLSYYGVGAAENVSYNDRFQPQHWHVTPTPWGGNPAPPPCQPPSWTAGWLDYVYNYVDSSGHNNGNVQSIFNNVSNGWSQNFTYDSLNRIATAQTNGTISNGAGNCWAETYTIDPWGNLYQFGINTTTQSAYIGCSQESGLTTQATTNNQLSGYGYDAAGNLISVPGIASYTYDAENHLISTAGYSYGYDGDGKRVMKSSGTSGTIYWYGASSMPLFETTLTGGGNFAYYYFNGRITNRREFAHFFTPDLYVHDALGNTNLASTTFPDGWDYSDYYPFGGEWVHQSVVGNRYKFTGKERDSESNLDNFGARYFSSQMGRMMSPDPLGGHLFDPQTLNKYVYVRDNPLRFTDPTGLDLKEQCAQESATCHKQHWFSRHRYVGTFDQHHHFDITHFQTDQNGNLAGHTANFDSTGPHIDNNRAEFIAGTPATRVNGTGAFDGMHAVFNSNCGGTCAAGGLLFGTPAQFQNLFGNLVGPNPGLDAIDFFHPGTDQYRGGNTEGPDAHLSFGSPVNGGQDFHFDNRYPYGSIGGFFDHTGGVIQTFGNFLTGQHGPPPPQDIRPSASVPQ